VTASSDAALSQKAFFENLAGLRDDLREIDERFKNRLSAREHLLLEDYIDGHFGIVVNLKGLGEAQDAGPYVLRVLLDKSIFDPSLALTTNFPNLQMLKQDSNKRCLSMLSSFLTTQSEKFPSL
jgi:hypothetical protein